MDGRLNVYIAAYQQQIDQLEKERFSLKFNIR